MYLRSHKNNRKEGNQFFMTRTNTLNLDVPVYASPTLFVVMRVSRTMNPRERERGELASGTLEAAELYCGCCMHLLPLVSSLRI